MLISYRGSYLISGFYRVFCFTTAFRVGGRNDRCMFTRYKSVKCGVRFGLY
jgi:hypothetical protein